MNPINRRDLLKLAGGLMAGAFLTPLPWRLFRDSSVLSQTGSWIQKLPRGGVTTGFSTCTLCPAGCGLRARAVAGIPYSLTGVPNHPLSFGTLCPAGLAAHHSAFNPSRVRTPLAFTHGDAGTSSAPLDLNDAKSRVAAALVKAEPGSTAILDLRPGRTASLAYRKMVAGRGRYIAAPDTESGLPRAMKTAGYGYDLAHAAFVLSFGAPILEGWGATGKPLANPSVNKPRIVQVETRRSRTGSLADRWIRLRPGSEAALALGLAYVVMHDGRCNAAAVERMTADLQEFTRLVDGFPPERVAALTDVPAEAIASLANELLSAPRSLTVAGGNLSEETSLAIMGLNIVLGNMNREGGVVLRNELPAPPELAETGIAPVSVLSEIPDHSLRVLIIDDPGNGTALPPEVVTRKLVPGESFVVCLSPYRAGLACLADLLISTPAPLEALADVPAPPIAANGSFAVSAPLLPKPETAADPVELIGNLFGMPGNSEQYLRGRVEAIRATGRGTVFNFADGTTSESASFGSADDLWSKLTAGAVWCDAASSACAPKPMAILGTAGAERIAAEAAPQTKEVNQKFPLTLMPFAYPAGTGAGQVSPLMTKVFQESGLRSTSDIALTDPVTASAAGLSEGDLATLETARGSRTVRIAIDRAGYPGAVHVAAGPDPSSCDMAAPKQNVLSFVDLDDECCWKPTPAVLNKEIIS